MRVITETHAVRLEKPVRIGELECEIDFVHRAFVEYAQDVVGEVSAPAAMEVYRADNPSRFRGLRLDPDRSTDTRWVYVDERGWAHLVLDVRRLDNRSWVIGGSEECAEE